MIASDANRLVRAAEKLHFWKVTTRRLPEGGWVVMFERTQGAAVTYSDFHEGQKFLLSHSGQ